MLGLGVADMFGGVGQAGTGTQVSDVNFRGILVLDTLFRVGVEVGQSSTAYGADEIKELMLATIAARFSGAMTLQGQQSAAHMAAMMFSTATVPELLPDTCEISGGQSNWATPGDDIAARTGELIMLTAADYTSWSAGVSMAPLQAVHV